MFCDLSVIVLDTPVSLAKMAELIKMMFQGQTRVRHGTMY